MIESTDLLHPLRQTSVQLRVIYRGGSRRRDGTGEGKFLVGMLDFHSNLDWLAAIRGPDRLCMDLLDVPEQVHHAMASTRELYPQTYDALYKAGNMAGRGTCGWLPFFCQERYATTQCDFACLLSPPQFNEFVLPALEEESDFLDHSIYHYDGATALQHFDAVTGIKSLDGIQWTPTAGGPPIADTQSGFRAYPLPETLALGVKARRFQYEIEVLVQARRRGLPVIEVPVSVTYEPEHISHFHPFFDFLRNFGVFSRLITQRVLGRNETPGERRPWG